MTELTGQMVRELYLRISNWGRWGSDDELGALNYISKSKRLEAAALIREGEAIGCGRIVDTVPSPMNNRPAKHFMAAAGDLAPERGAGVTYDEFSIFPHGQAQSHIDAWCHISNDRKMYNGRPASLVTSAGAKVGDMISAGDAIVSRAVFLDVADARGAEFIEPDAPIRPADLDRAVEQAGVEPGEGDILIYRTGRHERRAALGGECERLPDGRGHLPGLYPDCLEWIHDRKIALIGSDCAHDVLPSPISGEFIPIHVGAEVYMGLLLLHNLRLDALREACRKHDRRAFFFAVSPLQIAGGTASPVNPLAML
ncbi:MAG: cyclase family protein [Pseudomonadota bacterium]|nr:cyclase family protein [Pseudomonadota bacterium]